MAKLNRSTKIGFLVSSVLVLTANSRAQSHPSIIERIAKTYGLNSWNQVEATPGTCNWAIYWPTSLTLDRHTALNPFKPFQSCVKR